MSITADTTYPHRVPAVTSHRLLLPDYRTTGVCADRFPGRSFVVTYTSQANGVRAVMPPPRTDAGGYSFPQAVRVALDLVAKVPEWGPGDRPTIVSADGLLPSVCVCASDLVSLGRMAVFLSSVAGSPLVLELPTVRLPSVERGGYDEDDD